MTISDNNLCTLLDMTKKADTAKNLLSQLPIVLSSTYQHSANLEEVLTSNNEGLPVDRAEEYCRSKKPKIRNAPSDNDAVPPLPSEEYIEELLVSMNRNGLSSKSSTTPVSSTMLATSITLASSGVRTSSTSTSSNTPALTAPSSTKPASTPAGVVKVLSQSPHIIMCCPNNGSISYILTVPTAEGPKSITLPRIGRPSRGSNSPPVSVGQSGGNTLQPNVQANIGNSPLAGLQAERSSGRQGTNILLPRIQQEMLSSSSSSSGQGGDAEPGGSPMTRQPSGKGRKSRRTSSSKKGKEKAVEEQPTVDMLQSIQKAISSLLNSVTPEGGTGQGSSSLSRGSLDELSHSVEAAPSLMEATPNPMEATPLPTVSGLPPYISLHDYDPDMSTAASSEPQVSAIASSNAEACCSVSDDSFPLRIPEVPMSWFYSDLPAGPLSVDGERLLNEDSLTPPNRGDTSMASECNTLMDVDFGLDLDSDSWKQLLECSLDSPIKERHQVQDFSDTGCSHLNQFVGDLTAPDSVRVSDPLPVDVVATSNSERRRTIPATAGSDTWNGMWHNSDPDSINNWLKSSFPLGNTKG